jgi:hypothetical protein
MNKQKDIYNFRGAIAFAKFNGQTDIELLLMNKIFKNCTQETKIVSFSRLLNGKRTVTANIIKIFKELCGVEYEYILSELNID